MGRPIKPKHTKEQQGTLRPIREIKNPLTSKTLSSVPLCPEYFNDNEREFYNYTCSVLLSLNLLTPQFILDIRYTATWYHVAKESAAKIREGKIINQFATGHSVPHAYLTAFEKATKFLNEFNNHYGFNLTSSQRIEMPSIKGNDKENNMFE